MNLRKTIATALIFSAAVTSGLLVSPSTCDAADYDLDNSHTSLVFGISHFGYSFTYGRFNTLTGGFQFDKENPTASNFKFEIDSSSVDTNDAKRDEHLRGPDFFDAKQFPTITFESTSVREASEGLEMVGNMTMHGVSKEVTIPFKYLGEGKGPYGKYRCGFSAQVMVQRSDFGIKAMTPMIGDDVSITFSFEGIRK